MDIDELRNRHDELEDIISTLRGLIDSITDRDYIAKFENIIYEAQEELDNIEPILQEEYDKECKYRLEEYIRSVL